MTTPTRTNRRMQFTLRTLLIAATFLSILFAWLAVKAGQIKRERAAAVAFEELGGKVCWLFGPPTGSAWLQSLQSLQDDTSGHVIFWVELDGTQVEDTDLKHLTALPSLESLSLNQTRISDAGLEQIAGMTHLNDLSLCNTQITDAGLRYLEGLKALTRVNLKDTKVTDEGVKSLQLAVPACEIVR